MRVLFIGDVVGSPGRQGLREAMPALVAARPDAALLLVPDAARDVRFRDKPSVRGPPHVRFYAGAPLVLGDGARVGTLCVIDREPRKLRANELQALLDLAAIAAAEIGREGK